MEAVVAVEEEEAAIEAAEEGVVVAVAEAEAS